MSRPCKSVELSSKHFTEEEKKARVEAENKLRGNSDKIKAPTYLNPASKKIFRNIVRELEATGILTNIDIYILANYSIAVDRLEEAEKLLNKDILNREALRIKESYVKDLLKYTQELCLSPQSRAKVGSLNATVKETNSDPVLKILKGKK